MSEPYLGEIKMFAGNFAPRGYALCDGQLLSISQNDALFSLFGTIYGGDGRTTFGLPDLRGRVPVHEGQGAGLSDRRIGAKGGAETVTLSANNIPSHTHELQTAGTGTTASPAGATFANPSGTTLPYKAGGPLNANFGNKAVSSAGGSQSHTNLQPTLCINFIVALVGIFPSRN